VQLVDAAPHFLEMIGGGKVSRGQGNGQAMAVMDHGRFEAGPVFQHQLVQACMVGKIDPGR
jgi:hypothetical protein